MPQSLVSVWIIGAVIVVAVLAMSIVFLIKAIKRGQAIGMSKDIIMKAVKSSAIFSIVPSIPIVIGVGILMTFVGMAISWIRLSVIGALQYEIYAQQIVFAEGGDAESQMVLIATALTLMTVGIISGPIFNAIFYKKYQNKLAALQEKNEKAMNAVTGALMGGMLAGMTSAIVVNAFFALGDPKTDAAGITTFGEVTLIAWAASVVIMVICGLILKFGKQKWIENYALPLAMVGSMAIAYACTGLFA